MKENILKLYPLQFEPILKERIWGGKKLKTILDKPINSNITGESWEISSVEGDVSIVSNGFYKGVSLSELINQYPTEILGTKVFEKFGKQFPLLFKYLDAHENLSIQVHPDDTLAKNRHDSFGKNEMWFIMQAEPLAKIWVGFKENSNQQQYLDALHSEKIVDLLDAITVLPGDAFMLKTGTIHAIGAGIMLAEIQQTSDITYRIFDFNRKDANGNKRKLHTELALEAINYNKVKSQKQYRKEKNESNKIVDCKYFTTNFIQLTGKINIKKNDDSFVVYMCTQGCFEIILDDQRFSYKMGDTVLIPAKLQVYDLLGNASVLEIFIN